eukprot:3402846-Lingulodinium_polyedra.AAC.1
MASRRVRVLSRTTNIIIASLRSHFGSTSCCVPRSPAAMGKRGHSNKAISSFKHQVGEAAILERKKRMQESIIREVKLADEPSLTFKAWVSAGVLRAVLLLFV